LKGTPLPGVLLLEPRVFGEARGFFMETYRTDVFRDLGIAAAILMIAAGCSFLLRRQWPSAAYTLLSVAVPLSSGSLQSISR